MFVPLQTLTWKHKALQYAVVSLLVLVVPLKELALGIAAEAEATTELFGIYGVSLSSMTIVVSVSGVAFVIRTHC
jgi:hypothetical protein